MAAVTNFIHGTYQKTADAASFAGKGVYYTGMNTAEAVNTFFHENKEEFLKLIATTASWMDELGCGSLVSKSVKVLAGDVKNGLAGWGLVKTAGQDVEKAGEFLGASADLLIELANPTMQKLGAKAYKAASTMLPFFEKICLTVTSGYDVIGLLQAKNITFLSEGFMSTFGKCNAIVLTTVMGYQSVEKLYGIYKLCSGYSEAKKLGVDEKGVNKADEFLQGAIGKIETKGSSKPQITTFNQLLTKELLDLGKKVSTCALGVILMMGLIPAGAVLSKFAILVVSTVALAFSIASFAVTYWKGFAASAPSNTKPAGGNAGNGSNGPGAPGGPDVRNVPVLNSRVAPIDTQQNVPNRAEVAKVDNGFKGEIPDQQDHDQNLGLSTPTSPVNLPFPQDVSDENLGKEAV